MTKAEVLLNSSTDSIDDTLQMIMDAEKYGLNLNYSPEVVADTKDMELHQWEELRSSYIGGSSCGALVSPDRYSNAATVFNEIVKRVHEKSISPESRYFMDFGHSVEMINANYITDKTGWRFIKDTRMYRHPLYRFMSANLDGLMINNDGEIVGFESKSNEVNNRTKWASGVLGRDAVLFKPQYEWQCRHYMAVMNINRYYLVTSFGNNPNDIVIIRIDRDLYKEKYLIEAEKKFWEEHVLTGIEPEYTVLTDEQTEKITAAYSADKAGEKITISSEYKSVADEYLSIASEISELKDSIDKKNQRLNALKAELLKALEGAEEGRIRVSDRESILVANKEVVSSRIDTKKLKIVLPEVYSEYSRQSVSRRFSVSLREETK